MIRAGIRPPMDGRQIEQREICEEVKIALFTFALETICPN